MRVTIQTEITQHETCGACVEDEEASPGVHCQCRSEDVPLEVVGEVVADESKSDYPFGKLSVPACIEILSICDVDCAAAWSPAEIGFLEDGDKERILEALWLKYLETEPGEVLRRKAKRLGDLLATHVDLAVETRTEEKRINRMLERVAAAVLDVRTGGES